MSTLHASYTDETERSSIEATPAHGGVAVPPNTNSLEMTGVQSVRVRPRVREPSERRGRRLRMGQRPDNGTLTTTLASGKTRVSSHALSSAWMVRNRVEPDSPFRRTYDRFHR